MEPDRSLGASPGPLSTDQGAAAGSREPMQVRTCSRRASGRPAAMPAAQAVFWNCARRSRSSSAIRARRPGMGTRACPRPSRFVLASSPRCSTGIPLQLAQRTRNPFSLFDAGVGARTRRFGRQILVWFAVLDSGFRLLDSPLTSCSPAPRASRSHASSSTVSSGLHRKRTGGQIVLSPRVTYTWQCGPWTMPCWYFLP